MGRRQRMRLAAMIAGTLAAAPWIEAAAQGYLRLGVDAALESDSVFTDADCASVTPAALYGCGQGPDGAPYRSTGKFSSAAGIEVGAGYAVSPAVRVELRLGYRPSVRFEGLANFLAPGREQSVLMERSAHSAAVALELDLTSLGVPSLGAFRPFAGAGIGRVRHRVEETRMRFPRTETIVPGATVTEWAWAVTAGFSRRMTERMVLDLAWRYADEGDIQTGAGTGHVRWRDGSRTVALDLAPTLAETRYHQFGVTLRYAW